MKNTFIFGILLLVGFQFLLYTVASVDTSEPTEPVEQIFTKERFAKKSFVEMRTANLIAKRENELQQGIIMQSWFNEICKKVLDGHFNLDHIKRALESGKDDLIYVIDTYRYKEYLSHSTHPLFDITHDGLYQSIKAYTKAFGEPLKCRISGKNHKLDGCTIIVSVEDDTFFVKLQIGDEKDALAIKNQYF